MVWECRQHGKLCRAYPSSDANEMNDACVEEDKVREWYRKKYPHMGEDGADDYVLYVKKCLRWVK